MPRPAAAAMRNNGSIPQYPVTRAMITHTIIPANAPPALARKPFQYGPCGAILSTGPMALRLLAAASAVAAAAGSKRVPFAAFPDDSGGGVAAPPPLASDLPLRVS